MSDDIIWELSVAKAVFNAVKPADPRDAHFNASHAKLLQRVGDRIEDRAAEIERLKHHLKICVEQCEGCAVTHYAADHELFGLPQFISDARAALGDEK